MSETEYMRLDDKLTKVLDTVSRTDEKLKDYDNIRDKVLAHDKTIETIVSNCRMIQDAKKNKSVPWGNVKGMVIGGTLVLIITIVVNLLIALIK